LTDIIKCSNLYVKYDGREAVEGLTFNVEKGDYLCIVGENGSGKSTVVKTLLGLVKPDRGSIEFFGDGRRRDIGYLPQQTAIQRDFPASVKEVVLTGCIPRRALVPFYGAAERRRAAEAMERIGIADLSSRPYRELSGGQQQRVLLARAICAANELILLDEPVSGLDPDATAEMYSIIDELNKKSGVTVIMVSHDMEAVRSHAAHVLHMRNKPLFFGTVSDYFSSRASKEECK
jgi:zinc transport system ATP-binding protein